MSDLLLRAQSLFLLGNAITEAPAPAAAEPVKAVTEEVAAPAAAAEAAV